jgi:cytochrome P450
MKYVNMNQYKPVKDKLMAEIDELLPFEVWDSQGNQINEEKLLDACHYEKIQDNFDYTMMCFKESMRLEPPVGISTAHTTTKDVILA